MKTVFLFCFQSLMIFIIYNVNFINCQDSISENNNKNSIFQLFLFNNQDRNLKSLHLELLKSRNRKCENESNNSSLKGFNDTDLVEFSSLLKNFDYNKISENNTNRLIRYLNSTVSLCSMAII
jgi:hypothetical protein